MKQFHLSVILAVVTRRLTCDLDSLYLFLNYMTNDNVYIFQFPRVLNECTPYLLEQFAFLGELPVFTRENFAVETANAVAKYGAWHEVHPMHPEDHQVISPAVELAMINPKLEIITFDPDTGEVDDGPGDQIELPH